MSALTSAAGLGAAPLALDLGTTNVVIHTPGRGIVCCEPALVAVDKRDGRLRAVGRAARRLLESGSEPVVAVRPLRSGVIADYERSEQMVHALIRGVEGSRHAHPQVVASILTGATRLEREALEEVCLSAGARSARLIDESLAAAIGAGLPVESARAVLVVSLGGGSSEAAVITLGGIAAMRSIRVGSEALDEAIIRHLRRERGVVVDARAGEQVKRALGAAFPVRDAAAAEISGTDAASGWPRTVALSGEEVRHALERPVAQIVAAVKETLHAAPPELSGDVIDRGIVLVGGGALLHGLEERLRREIGVPTQIAELPLTCVAEGLGRIAMTTAGERSERSQSKPRLTALTTEIASEERGIDVNRREVKVSVMTSAEQNNADFDRAEVDTPSQGVQRAEQLEPAGGSMPPQAVPRTGPSIEIDADPAADESLLELSERAADGGPDADATQLDDIPEDPARDRAARRLRSRSLPISAGERERQIELVRAVEFPIRVRGYDRGAVDRYVEWVNRLLTELDLSSSPEAAVRHALDEVTDETRDILRQAHQAAEEITTRARRGAESRLKQARAQAQEALSVAEHEAAEVRAAAARETAELRERARREADELAGSAEAQARTLRDLALRESTELRAGTDRDVQTLRANAEREAEELRVHTRRDMDVIVGRAEDDARQLARNAEQIWRERRRLTAELRALGEQVLEIAEVESKRFVHPPEELHVREQPSAGAERAAGQGPMPLPRSAAR